MDDCQGGGDFHGKFVSPNAFFRHFLQNDERVAVFLGREVDQRKKNMVQLTQQIELSFT
jgi:hypothetical protein